MRTQTMKTVKPLTILSLAMLVIAPFAFAQEDELADADIARAIENELLFDRAIDLNRIDVSVREGIAELTGTVSQALTKERATQIVERVKGVRSVSNRLEVRPSVMRSNSDIRTDVVEALLRDPATDSYELVVGVDDGVVTLSGSVESWAEQQLSETVAKGVKGVTDVQNQIDIDFVTDRPDREILPEIEKRLRWDVWVDDGAIDVAVNDGQVTLTGSVGSAAERRRARTDAWVSGVRSVDDSGLEVQWWAKDEDLRKQKYVSRADNEIAVAIKDAALYDPRVKSFDLDTDVQGGWVTLRGTVDNLTAKLAAENLARHTVGVVGVTNRLKVRPLDDRSDRIIAQDIEDALLANPTTDAYDITVNVSYGRATLSGTVDTVYEKSLAESIASTVQGVTDVYNLLITPSQYATSSYPWTWTDWITHPPLTDEAIYDQIQDEFFWSPYVDNDVTVEVKDSVATLRGTVDSWRGYRAAAENAFEGGATSVVNRLAVQPGNP